MKKLFGLSLITSLLSLSAFADINKNLNEELDLPLTDEEAMELGMTHIFEGAANQKNRNSSNFIFKDSGLDIAKVVVLINKSVRTSRNPDGQTLKVYQNGVFVHEFDTSTGTEKIKETSSGRKYIATTPVGVIRPKRAFNKYQSATFRGANMDFAVFFRGGIATHSTSKAAYRNLGKRASGGCARLKFEDARTVNEIIRATSGGTDLLRDAGFDGLSRTQYFDRIKLPNLARYSGVSLGATSKLWTYDAAIIVTE